MTTDTATRLLNTKTMRLETRRRDGSWVATPVSLVTEGNHHYFRSYDAAGKAKRLNNFSEIRGAAASRIRGKPHGPTYAGQARLLQGEDADHARALLARRFPLLHGRFVPWYHRRKGWTTLHYEFLIEP